MSTELLSTRPLGVRSDPVIVAEALLPTGTWPASLKLLQQYAEWLNLPLLCCDLRTGKVLARTDSQQLQVVPNELLRMGGTLSGPRMFPLSSGLIAFALPLPALQGTPVAAVGYVLEQPGVRPEELVLTATSEGWTAGELQDWLSTVPYCQAEFLHRQLELAVRLGKQVQASSSRDTEFSQMCEQLEYTYEEINLLHTLTQNMQLSRAPRDLARLSLERLMGVISAEGHAIALNDDGQGIVFQTEGTVPLNAGRLEELVARFEDHDWSRPLIKNHLEGTLLGSDFPGLRNFVLLAIAERNQRFGWLLSCNLAEGKEFGTVQASLLSSVSSILGTHGRNIDLYHQHEELLLCFVRSLVSTLDAKDPYTRGHSERVALIARRLGAEMNLPEDDLREIYLSGLLHDIGKIGVDDSILRKPGQLTPEEFEQIKKHPVIGYNILAGLKNLRSVIPGVRHHHEAWNGKGYPDGLAGEGIPLMARILAVADSYDAMGSDRPYRKGMPLELLENVLRKGAGEQWDPTVVRAFFNSKDAILRICESYNLTHTNLLDADNRPPVLLENSSAQATLSGGLTPEKLRQMFSVVSSLHSTVD